MRNCSHFVKGDLSETAMKAIAGYLTLAPSLTAFGNLNPTSYLRLVPHQEAPTNICWGDRNRSVLVRVPLGWRGSKNLSQEINPYDKDETRDLSNRQTVEFRCPDGSADVYLLMAGLTIAARHGFEMKDALEFAKKTYVDVNIFEDEHKEKLDQLSQLPSSCYESAVCLDKQKSIYEEYDVFPARMIDWIVEYLKNFNDQNLREELAKNPEKVMELVRRFYHCG